MTDDRIAELEKRVAELEYVVNEHHQYFAAAALEELPPDARQEPPPNLFGLGKEREKKADPPPS